MLQSYTAVTMAVERTYVVKFDDGVEMKFELFTSDTLTKIECRGAWITFNTPRPENTIIYNIKNTSMGFQGSNRFDYFVMRVLIAWYLIIKECFPNIEEAHYTNRCVVDAIENVSEKTKEEVYEEFKKVHWRLFYYYRLGFYVNNMETAEEYVNLEWKELMSSVYYDGQLQEYLNDHCMDGEIIHCKLMKSGKKLLENGVYSKRFKKMIKFGAELRMVGMLDWPIPVASKRKRMRYSALQLLVF